MLLYIPNTTKYNQSNVVGGNVGSYIVWSRGVNSIQEEGTYPMLSSNSCAQQVQREGKENLKQNNIYNL
jgi:hypothetical protein